MLVFWRIIGIAAVLLLFDCLFSWLSTCDPASYPSPTNESYEKHCSAFKGPFVTIASVILIWTRHVLHDYGEAVIAIFTIVLALSTMALWRSGKRQMELIEKNAIQQSADTRAAIAAAEAANKISQESVLIDQRAWLAVSDLQIREDVRFFRHGADFHMSVKITNFGKTPAMAAHTDMEMIEGGSTEAVKKLAEKAAENAKVEGTYWGRIVFPGESYRRNWGLTANLPTPPSNSISPIVIGCVTYQILPDQSVHQTGFAFGLFECKPGTNEYVRLIRVDEGQISRDRIGNNADPGGFAD